MAKPTTALVKLAFFPLGNLPTNWAGVALIALANVLFIAELSTDGSGILGVGAVVAFLLGGLIHFRPLRLASPALPDLCTSPWVIALTTITVGSLVLLLMRQVMLIRHAPVKIGSEHYLEQIALPRRLYLAGSASFTFESGNSPIKPATGRIDGKG